MNESLVLLADGRIVGELRRDLRGRLTLVYAESWRTAPDAWPASLSLPLVVPEHEHGRVEPWLRGLLPASSRETFAQLAALGADAAGALQIVRPERVAAILEARPMNVVWLSRAAMVERLRSLGRDPGAPSQSGEAGAFALPGAAPKLALVFNGQHWGVPSLRTPTTHILKPAADGSGAHLCSLHLCLALARALGLPAARTRLVRFDDIQALAVERFDRVRDSSVVRRLHQEHLAQAFGPIRRRNERAAGDTGPSPARLCAFVRSHSAAPQEDAWTVARAFMLNWLIAGRPLRPQDIAILIGGGGRVRLAPLYGPASTLLANPGADRADAADNRLWTRFAKAARLPAAQVLDACSAMAQAMPEALPRALAAAKRDGGDDPRLAQLAAMLAERARRLAQTL